MPQTAPAPPPPPPAGWRAPLLPLLFLVAPLAARVASLLGKGLSPSAIDLRGALADLTVGSLLYSLSLLAAHRHRAIAATLAIGWLLVIVINYEHVRALETLAAAGNASYLLDPTFVAGSVLGVGPGLWAVLVAGVATALLARPGPVSRRDVLTLSATAALGVAVVAALPIRRGHLEWRQRNVLSANLARAWDQVRPAGPQVVVRTGTPDLSGSPRIALASRRPNVLLVLLEGVSGGYLESLAAHHGVSYPGLRMSKLDAIARRGLSFASFVNHQRQTNRGQYTLLCGDQPKLGSGVSKMSERAVTSQPLACLPRALTELGYDTVYLQSAPLSFMWKDYFLPLAGFGTVHGHEWFEGRKARSRNAWGVDDATLLEGGLTLIDELERGDRPWFLTLLTSGTHHPQNVPSGYAAPHPTETRGRAFLYLDDAVAAFVDALDARGLTDDTLVLFTSDESAGLRFGAVEAGTTLTQNWGFFVALVPAVAEATMVAEMFAQSDVPLSILDYLGAADDSLPFAGRSLFRSYPERRAIYFANTYAKTVGGFATDGVRTMCDESLTDCAAYTYDPQRPFATTVARTATRPAAVARLRAAVLASRVSAAEPAARRTYDLVRADRVNIAADAQTQLIFGGQYLSAAAGDVAVVEIDVELVGTDASVQPQHYFYSKSLGDEGRRHIEPELPAMQAGDRLIARYSFRFAEPRREISTSLDVRPIAGSAIALVIHRATLQLDSSPRPDTPFGATREFLGVTRPTSP